MALGRSCAGVPAPGGRRRGAEPRRRPSERCPRRPDGRCPTPADLAASTPTRCAASTPAPGAAMVAEIDAAARDGDTLGGVVEVVAYGLPPGLGSFVHWRPPPGRPAGRGADGHPGDQGRRGRRRLRARPAPRLAGARRDRAVRDGVIRRRPPAGRRHRGRHDHRRGAAGPRGHEADLDGAAGAVDRSTSRTGEAAKAIHQRSDVCAVPGRRRGRRGDGRAGARRRGAGEVRRRLGRETRRNLEGYLDVRDPDSSAAAGQSARRGCPPSADDRPDAVLVGPPGAGKTTVGQLVADRLGTGFRGHRR